MSNNDNTLQQSEQPYVVRRRSVIFGILFGLIFVAGGLFFIFGKDMLWSLTQGFFGLLGIQSVRTQGWEWLTNAIGLLIGLFGVFVIWVVIQIGRNARG